MDCMCALVVSLVPSTALMSSCSCCLHWHIVGSQVFPFAFAFMGFSGVQGWCPSWCSRFVRSMASFSSCCCCQLLTSGVQCLHLLRCAQGLCLLAYVLGFWVLVFGGDRLPHCNVAYAKFCHNNPSMEARRVLGANRFAEWTDEHNLTTVSHLRTGGMCTCSLLHNQMTFPVDLQPTSTYNPLIAVKLIHLSYDTCDRNGNKVIVLGRQVCSVDMMILIAKHT